jgi:hypothetical protein
MPTNRRRKSYERKDRVSDRIKAMLNDGHDHYPILGDEPDPPTIEDIRQAWQELRPDFDADTPAEDVLAIEGCYIPADRKMSATFGFWIFELGRTKAEWREHVCPPPANNSYRVSEEIERLHKQNKLRANEGIGVTD